MNLAITHVLQFFKYDHLPDKLKKVSAPFAELAHSVAVSADNPEVTVALRKLLEAKDAAVRAVLSLVFCLLFASPIYAQCGTRSFYCAPSYCAPTYVNRVSVVTPFIPVQPVSTVIIAQFSAVVPTYTVGLVPGLGSYGIGGAAGYQPVIPGQAIPGAGAVPGGAATPTGPVPQQPGTVTPPGQLPPPGQPGQPDVQAMMAELQALRAELARLQKQGKAEEEPEKPIPLDKLKPAPEKADPKAPASSSQRGSVHQPLAFLNQKCQACHTGRGAEGGLDLSAGLERLTATQLARTVARVSADTMPPRREQHKHPPLTPAEKQDLARQVAVLTQQARRG